MQIEIYSVGWAFKIAIAGAKVQRWQANDAAGNYGERYCALETGGKIAEAIEQASNIGRHGLRIATVVAHCPLTRQSHLIQCPARGHIEITQSMCSAIQ